MTLRGRSWVEREAMSTPVAHRKASTSLEPYSSIHLVPFIQLLSIAMKQISWHKACKKNGSTGKVQPFAHNWSM